MIIRMIAKKILREELEGYEKEVNDIRSEKSKIESEKEREISIYIGKLTKANEEIERLKSENEVFKKYYELDKDPSEEVKTRIHVDLEVNRLKFELMRCMLMQSSSYLHVPYVFPNGRMLL